MSILKLLHADINLLKTKTNLNYICTDIVYSVQKTLFCGCKNQEVNSVQINCLFHEPNNTHSRQNV
jgi:hypothetical protein